ncbi:MAG: alanine--glyoxylate aminotransferase family protein [Gemmatales bacterium]|nr:alanine--glyoxylate aminotransferase family protein [Gemmatales bacterium]MDW7994945.1 alanine--glyoxylate aminotransferase family protein [Gemmatales bacterium]
MFKYRLLTPGPTPVPEDTLLELARPVPHHRTAEARQILADVVEGLRYVFQTRGDVIPLTCSGTGAMEAALIHAVPRGAKALCLVAGKFGERWHQIWRTYGVESVAITAPPGQVVTPAMVETALRQHPDAQAVCVVHCETSTGVKHDLKALGELVAQTDAVLLVDAVSSAGAMELRMDDWHIDFLATGSQKALMLPPGLAFVAVSDKGWRAAQRHQPPAFYFDLKKARDKIREHDTPFTPAHTLLRALRRSLEKIRTEGIEAVWWRHARLAHACRAAVQALGLELFATVPAESLTAVRVPAQLDGQEILRRLEKDYGIKLAGGQDQLKGKILRIAHMGYIDFFDLLAAIAALELVLRDLGFDVPAGRGVAAAQRAFAEFHCSSGSSN